MKLRVVSYNIRVGVETSLDAVASAVASLAPDLVCLQEIGDRWLMGEKVNQAAHIARAAGLDYAHFGGALTAADGGQFGVAIVSRWPLEHVELERLYQDRDERRVLLRARVCAPVPFWLLTTHLSVLGPERLVQAARVRAAAAQLAGPVLLGGDLNDEAEAPSTLACRGPLRCAFDDAGTGDPNTFPSVKPVRRIDFIFHDPRFKPSGPTWVARDISASDHCPLVADLELSGPR